MHRRALLASLASLSLLSGCSGAPARTQTPNSTTTHKTTTEATTTSTTASTTTTQQIQELAIGETATIGDGAARLYSVEAARTIITLDGIHFGIVTEPDAQYLVVAMTTEEAVDGHTAARTNTILELDDGTYPVSEHRFHPAAGGGFNIAYRLPLTLDASHGRILWGPYSDTALAAWTLPDAVITRLNNPPEFTVHAFTVPAEAASFDSFDVTIDVENTGAGDGEFTALLGNSRATDSAPLLVTLAHGKRTTVTETKQIDGDPGDTRTIYLDWGLERLERTITITE